MTRKLSLTVDGKNVAVHLHKGDLPDSVSFKGAVAVDSETMGLSLVRDPLCLVQLSDGGGEAHLVQLDRSNYEAANLKRVLTDAGVLKLFHFARFDVAMFMRDLSVVTTPIYCTKIASKLVRTYTDRHGLKDLLRETLDIDISKQQQSSDWGAATLSTAQIEYAASDVLYLHRLRDVLDARLAREGRTTLARACFDFLPHRALLDLAGWPDLDVFAHA
jgi:ribonuclease D